MALIAANPVDREGRRRGKREPRRKERGNRGRKRQRRTTGEEDCEKEALAEVEEVDGEIDIDEVSVRGGVKAFASHPVVQMFAKRRACMRKTSQITKRPTLLHMVGLIVYCLF